MKIILMLPLLFSTSMSFSQAPASNPLQKFAEPNFKEHQFYLTEPAIKLMELQYDKDCTPVNGKLSDDGKTIFIKDYLEHSRIYLKYLKADGKVEEIIKSPCFIDPVIPVL